MMLGTALGLTTGEDAVDVWWIEAKLVAKHLTCTHDNLLDQNFNHDKLDQLGASVLFPILRAYHTV